MRGRKSTVGSNPTLSATAFVLPPRSGERLTPARFETRSNAGATRCQRVVPRSSSSAGGSTSRQSACLRSRDRRRPDRARSEDTAPKVAATRSTKTGLSSGSSCAMAKKKKRDLGIGKPRHDTPPTGSMAAAGKLDALPITQELQQDRHALAWLLALIQPPGPSEVDRG